MDVGDETIIRFLIRLGASFTNKKANTGCNGKYWHQYAESAKRNTRETHNSHHDEINGKQQHADILVFHNYSFTRNSPSPSPA